MADDPNEESWLYGSNPEPPEEQDNKDASEVQNDETANEDDKPDADKEAENAVSWRVVNRIVIVYVLIIFLYL